MVGVDRSEESLKELAPFGRLVAYGAASRETKTVEVGGLMARSQAVVGFWLVHCLRQPTEMVVEPLRELFGRVASGELRVIEGAVYPLSEARRAHEDLRARKTVGKLVLDPAS